MWDTLTGNGIWVTENTVVRQNLSCAISVITIDAGLTVTGYTIQAVFKNSLANLYILGLSSGMFMGSVVAMMLVPTAILLVASWFWRLLCAC